MDAKIRLFLLVSEYIMLESQLEYLYREPSDKRDKVTENAKAIRSELQKIVDSSIAIALERLPNGIETIYQELGITRV